MNKPVTTDVAYEAGGERMLGCFCAPAGARNLPGLTLVHDAFGLTDDVVREAQGWAGLGYAVLAADVWGDRTLPQSQDEIEPLIGGMVANRGRWMRRIGAAHDLLRARDEVDADRTSLMGYCFGGSTALEYLRTGGAATAAISVHGGLDLLEFDWSAASHDLHVLVCTGADDPMATAEQRAALQGGMSSAGVDWQVDLYSDTRHAFTSPHAVTPNPVAAYNPRSAARARASALRFLDEILPAAAPIA